MKGSVLLARDEHACYTIDYGRRGIKNDPEGIVSVYTRHTIAFSRAVSLSRSHTLLHQKPLPLDRAHPDLDVVRPHKPLLVQIPLLRRILELNLPPSASTRISLGITLTSYFPNTKLTTLYSSISASGLPRQVRFPPPNAISASFMLFSRASKTSSLSSSPRSHRSGRYTSASGPKMRVSLCTTHGFAPTMVPGGRTVPSGNVRPVAGTTRSRIWPMTGWMRSPSLMQASRYGNFSRD